MSTRLRSFLTFFALSAVAAVFAAAEPTIHTQVDTVPQPLLTPPPAYPAELKGSATEGMVLLSVVIDDAGMVNSAEVVKATDSAFAEPSLAAVKAWKFRPAVKGGEKVWVRLKLPIKFSTSS